MKVFSRGLTAVTRTELNLVIYLVWWPQHDQSSSDPVASIFSTKHLIIITHRISGCELLTVFEKADRSIDYRRTTHWLKDDVELGN